MTLDEIGSTLTFTERFRTQQRTALLVVLVSALALVAASCQYTQAAVEHEKSEPTTRPWWCMSTGTGGHHVETAYEGQVKGMLSWGDCKANSISFDAALDYASQWPTLGDAEADGFHAMVNYVEGMGTHHVRLGDFDPSVFDPNNPTFPGTRIDDLFSSGRPEFLMYGGNSADSELVGFAWYVKTTATTPPPGFAGNNDWWHRHPTLCFNNDMRVIANGPCTSNGTNVNLSEYWMSHAWIVEGWNTKSDVFMNHHPCLMPGGPAADGDPCWDVAESGGGH